jgi:hypothetical protein
MLHRFAAAACVAAFALSLAACTTTGGNDTSASEDARGVEGDASPRPAGALELGAVEDESLRELIYKGLDERLSRTLTVGEGAEEVTEIGDYDSFRFTIVKLTRGADDVSGDPRAVPDGMDVEVSGWYKRTLKGDGDGKPQCTSFDAQLTVLKTQGEWRVSDEHPVTFGREDAEDCY